MSKTYTKNDRIRRINFTTANRYIRRFGGHIEEASITWAGSEAYYAVWMTDILMHPNRKQGKLIAEVI